MSHRLDLSKIVNITAIALLLCLVGVGFLVMDRTAESNAVTTRVANIQSREESHLVEEVRQLTSEFRNLQDNIDSIRDFIESQTEEEEIEDTQE